MTKHNFFIRFDGGHAVACYPAFAGGSVFDISREKVFDNTEQAEQFLKDKAQQHAFEIEHAESF